MANKHKEQQRRADKRRKDLKAKADKKAKAKALREFEQQVEAHKRKERIKGMFPPVMPVAMPMPSSDLGMATFYRHTRDLRMATISQD